MRREKREKKGLPEIKIKKINVIRSNGISRMINTKEVKGLVILSL
jgi:hypothetical protein